MTPASPGKFTSTSTSLEALCDELSYWCVDNRLPYKSADELLLNADLTPEDRFWLETFIKRWDNTVAAVKRGQED